MISDTAGEKRCKFVCVMTLYYFQTNSLRVHCTLYSFRLYRLSVYLFNLEITYQVSGSITDTYYIVAATLVAQ